MAAEQELLIREAASAHEAAAAAQAAEGAAAGSAEVLPSPAQLVLARSHCQ